jgi:hypothetical protein
MRSSPTGWAAEVLGKHGEYLVDVEKWGDKGEALVVDAKSARLVPAEKLPGFQTLVPLHRVVAVMPSAPDWRVEADRFGPFPGFSTPIAAWVLDGHGAFWPVIGVSEPEGRGPMRPNPEGEVTLRAAWSSGNKIVSPDGAGR